MNQNQSGEIKNNYSLFTEIYYVHTRKKYHTWQSRLHYMHLPECNSYQTGIYTKRALVLVPVGYHTGVIYSPKAQIKTGCTKPCRKFRYAKQQSRFCTPGNLTARIPAQEV
jgi:hypothetical protein